MMAWRLNEFLPLHIANRLNKKLKEMSMFLANTKVGVLGLAYKRDVDDVRYSPAERLVRLLQTYGAKTLVCDPNVEGALPLDKVLGEADVIVLAVNHSAFAGLEEKIEASHNVKLVFDCWAYYDERKFKRVKYLRLGKG
jgi:UDP-N-acetyl-D-mannosaminuronate dehydrogenase